MNGEDSLHEEQQHVFLNMCVFELWPWWSLSYHAVKAHLIMQQPIFWHGC
jgi:hypothetical protein